MNRMHLMGFAPGLELHVMSCVGCIRYEMLQPEIQRVCLLGWEFWGTLENFQTIISLKYIQ